MIFNMSRRTFLAATSVALLSVKSWSQTEGIRVGCQANAFLLKRGDFSSFLKALETMKSLGYTGFECNFAVVQSEFERTAAAREQIERTGMKFIGAHANMQQLGAQGEQIASGVAALGAGCIVLSSREGLSPEGKFEKSALLAKAKQLEEFAKMLAAHNLRLAYHNHNPEFANHNAEVTGLAENTKPELVSFLMDAGQAYSAGGDPVAFLSAFPKRVHGIHLKTFKASERRQVPLGQGDFDYQALAAAVKKTRWSGWLIDEEGGGPAADKTATLGPDREYIRKVFGA